MSYTISLKIKPETYQQFSLIHQKLNAGDREPQAKALGDNLAQIACEVIEQAFGGLKNKDNGKDQETSKVLNQVQESIMKYMPWSVSFFGNDRLVALVNYIYETMKQKDGQSFVTYQVERSVVETFGQQLAQMREGNAQASTPGIKSFVQIVDQGVTSLIREPKKMLKFNFVVDKTLNGVINLMTQLGYKRFEKLGTVHEPKSLAKYFDNFMGFLDR